MLLVLRIEGYLANIITIAGLTLSFGNSAIFCKFDVILMFDAERMAPDFFYFNIFIVKINLIIWFY